MKITKKMSRRALFLIVVVLPVSGALAQENQVTIDAQVGVISTNNILRGSDTAGEPALDETIYLAGAAFSFLRKTARVSADISGEVNRRSYENGFVDDETLARAYANAAAVLVEDRLRWTFNADHGQQIVNYLQAPSPDNREDVTVLSTGPTLQLPIGTRNRVTATATVADIQYELRPLDSHGLRGEIGFVRDVSEERSLSLNVESYRLEYDRSDLSAPIDTQKAFFAINSKNVRSNTNLKIGSNRFETAGIDGDGLFLDLGIDRQISPSARLLVSLGTSYETNGDLFRRFNSFGRQAGIVVSPADEGVDAQDLDDVYRRDFASVVYSYSRVRTSVLASIDWQDQDYESSNGFDRQVIRLRGSVSRELTPKFLVSGYLSLSNLDYAVDPRKDDDVSIGVGMDYIVGKRLSIQLSIEHHDRGSDLRAASYNELRGSLLFRYSLLAD